MSQEQEPDDQAARNKVAEEMLNAERQAVRIRAAEELLNAERQERAQKCYAELVEVCNKWRCDLGSLVQVIAK